MTTQSRTLPPEATPTAVSSTVSAPEHTLALTPKAAKIIKAAFAEQNVVDQHAFIRVGAERGGCSGYKFYIDFAEASQRRTEDAVFRSQGLQLLVDRTCLDSVLGSLEIDYREGNLVERGFVFRRLGDGASCGCGESFTPLQ